MIYLYVFIYNLSRGGARIVYIHVLSVFLTDCFLLHFTCFIVSRTLIISPARVQFRDRHMFHSQDTHKVFLKTSLFCQSKMLIPYCIPAGDTMRAQGPPTRGPPCHPPSRTRKKLTKPRMEKPKVPEPKDPTHQDQGLDLSAATWQPQATPPAYQTWASPQ